MSVKERTVYSEGAHYPFYKELQNGGKVWRDDPRNGIQEWLTLDHPDIHGNAANITRFGFQNLSLPNCTLEAEAEQGGC